MLTLCKRYTILTFVLVTFFLLSLALPGFDNQTVFAQTPSEISTPNIDEFRTELTTTYTVDQASITRVKHEFIITNLTPTTFIKQYALSTAYPNLTNIVVTENGQEVEANVVSTDRETTIAITFPRDVVGENKARSFSIEYINPDLASIGGNVLEIHAPELSDPEQYDEHQVILITPIQYGNPVRSNPEPTNTTISEAGIRSTFTDLGGKSLSVLFGESQIYDLTLRYNLENPSSSEAFTQIALPPDTSFQKLHYHALDPMPQELKRDQDGNWIAKYNLPASSITPVYLTAIAQVTLNPQENGNVATPLPEHTRRADYWNTRDAQVAAEASQYNTPENIYNYVTKTLNYAETIEGIPPRQGAAKALDNPNAAVCQEFTDLFVTMARANDIPARRLTGYAYSQNEALRPLSLEGDVLHAWPEYYDAEKELWVPVDPTWGNTTGGVDYFHQFDLNHIVFAINGVSSVTPHPAGSYKAQNEETKDVEVTFTDNFPQVEPDFSLAFEPLTALNLPLPGFYTLSITNKTGQAWYDITAQFENTADSVRVNHGENLHIPALLPFQTQTFTITAHTPQWQIVSDVPVTVQLAQTGAPSYVSQEQYITAGPAFIGYFKNPQVLFGLGIGIVLIILIGGSILVFRRT